MTDAEVVEKYKGKVTLIRDQYCLIFQDYTGSIHNWELRNIILDDDIARAGALKGQGLIQHLKRINRKVYTLYQFLSIRQKDKERIPF